jgi:N-acetylneuraminic acid mutarotase
MTRRTFVLAASGLVAIALAAFLAARTFDVRGLLGLRTAASAELDGGCRSAQNVLLPFGLESPDGRWQMLPPAPIAQDELRAAASGGLVYVGTGLEQRRPGADLTSTNAFFVFDPKRKTYSRLPPLPRRVDHPALVATGGNLYLIGGFHDGRPTADAFMYSTATGEWTTLPSMPTPRGSPASAAIGEKIYVVGGVGNYLTEEAEPVATLEIYDIATRRWSTGPTMPTPRHHAGAAVVGGEFYVVGGRGKDDLSLAAAERFDPVTNRWRSISPLPLGAGGLAAVAVAERVIAVGGGDDDEAWVTPATWAFDPASDRWQRLADLSVARHGHAAAALGNTAYVFGGAPCPGYAETDSAESLLVAGS